MPFGSIVRSIANIRLWRGATPKVLQGGRVDVHVGAVAAGAIGPKRIQRGYTTIFSIAAGGTGAITLPNSVTPSKCVLIPFFYGGRGNFTLAFTGNTTLTATNRHTSTQTIRFEWQVLEFA